MELTQKQQILTDGFDEVMKHHLHGNYINMSYVEGLEYPDILWDIDLNKYDLVAYTEFGLYRYNYDFDFDFDENLNQFLEGLQEFLYYQLA